MVLGRAEVVDEERDIVANPLVVGLEGLGVVILDRTAEVCVIEKRLQYLFLQIMDIAFMERLVETRFLGIFPFRKNLLGQGPGRVLLLGLAAESETRARRRSPAPRSLPSMALRNSSLISSFSLVKRQTATEPGSKLTANI